MVDLVYMMGKNFIVVEEKQIELIGLFVEINCENNFVECLDLIEFVVVDQIDQLLVNL